MNLTIEIPTLPPEYTSALEVFLQRQDIYGELGRPSSLDNFHIVDLTSISHHITDIKMVNDKILANVKILNTPMGKILQQLAMDAPTSFTFKFRTIQIHTPECSTLENSDISTRTVTFKRTIVTIDAVPNCEPDYTTLGYNNHV